MPSAVSVGLYASLAQCSDKIQKPRSAVLFRRGDKAVGLFLIMKGSVALDLGVDAVPGIASLCGPGALVGLPATLSNGNYSMTATVTENAELGFIRSEALFSLLREHPELCQQLLAVLGEKMAYFDRAVKAMKGNSRVPRQNRELRNAPFGASSPRVY
jgi:CRP-like cAMP-binding protein